MLRLVEGFAGQLRDARDVGANAGITVSGTGVRAVVAAGMGGSAIGAEIASAHLAGIMGVPFLVVRNYELPAFVGGDTLVVAASYSGNTEETLAAYRQAHERGARVVCITTGGALAAAGRADGHDVVLIREGLPPRAALGYGLVPLLVLLSRLGLAPDPARDIEDAIGAAEEAASSWGGGAPAERNAAKRLALWLEGGIPVVYGSTPRTAAVATRWCGQLSENAKVVAHRADIPEMNHNELVGWSGDRPLCGAARVVLLHEAGDHARNALRADFTRREVERGGAVACDVRGGGSGPLGRMVSLVLMGDFTSVYLAALTGVDPTPVEPIGRLKKELAGFPAAAVTERRTS
jgi:glucose/mannose-6-phosphate isomerase